MQTLTARASSTRTRSPRKPPSVGTRIAGHRFDWSSDFTGIYSHGSAFGELGDASWFRLRANIYGSDPTKWRVSSTLCGHSNHFDAVINDFGDLVAVPQ